ncbi:hypothetical protein QJS66_19870 [Kocuria rhizophila]|nr:hypothetical protein QJS66_19870 [Kocuria rhizophila]
MDHNLAVAGWPSCAAPRVEWDTDAACVVASTTAQHFSFKQPPDHRRGTGRALRGRGWLFEARAPGADHREALVQDRQAAVAQAERLGEQQRAGGRGAQTARAESRRGVVVRRSPAHGRERCPPSCPETIGRRTEQPAGTSPCPPARCGTRTPVRPGAHQASPAAWTTVLPATQGALTATTGLPAPGHHRHARSPDPDLAAGQPGTARGGDPRRARPRGRRAHRARERHRVRGARGARAPPRRPA